MFRFHTEGAAASDCPISTEISPTLLQQRCRVAVAILFLRWNDDCGRDLISAFQLQQAHALGGAPGLES